MRGKGLKVNGIRARKVAGRSGGCETDDRGVDDLNAPEGRLAGDPDRRRHTSRLGGEREETAEALARQGGLFRTIVENSSEIVNVVDPDGTVRYASPAAERVMGYAPGEMIGDNVLRYVHPDDLPLIVGETAKALREPGVARNAASYRFRHKDGSWRHVESTGTYLLDDPNVGGVVVVSRDVTERKRAEENEGRLEESEGRFRAVVEGMGEGLLITDPGDIVLYANPRMTQLTGYADWEMLGRPAHELLLPPERWAEAQARNRRRAERITERYEMPLLRKDGSEFWAEVHATPYRDRSGNVVGTLGALTDITERKEAEGRLKESEKRYWRRARELDLLHRVRTALARMLDPVAVFRAVVEAVAETYGYVLVSAYGLEGDSREGGGVLVLQHQVGYRTVLERIPLSRGVMARTVRSGRPILVSTPGSGWPRSATGR